MGTVDLIETIQSLRRSITDRPGDDMNKMDLLLVRSTCINVLGMCEALANIIAELSEVSQAALEVVATGATANPELTPIVSELSTRLIAAREKFQGIATSITVADRRANSEGELNDE